ncbi:MAG: hypothetical protein ACOCRL_02090 [Bacillota bacterium]
MDIFKNEEGYTFIIVIWTLVIIGIIFSSLYDEVTLNNLLVRNNVQEKRLYQEAVSGVSLAIHALKEDETLYDSSFDKWTEEISYEGENGITSVVNIVPIGNKLNINYTDQAILRQLNWWNENIEKEIAEVLIPDLVFMKSILGDNFEKSKEILTTYGRFNVNDDEITGMDKILRNAEIQDALREQITESLKNHRENKKIESLEVLMDEIEGLDDGIFEKIEKYLTTEGRININFVNEEVMKFIFKNEKIESRSYENILSLREEEEITDLHDIDEFIPRDGKEKIIKYFSVSSNYFKVNVKSSSSEGNTVYNLEAIIERNYNKEDEEWNLQVIKWKTDQQIAESD